MVELENSVWQSRARKVAKKMTKYLLRLAFIGWFEGAQFKGQNILEIKQSKS